MPVLVWSPLIYMAKKLALKIFIDDLTGDIKSIEPTKRFEEEGPLFKIDVLKDAAMALENVYEYEKEKFFDEIVIDAGSDGKIAKA